MEKENFSWGGIGFLAIFILIILAFFRGNGGFFNGGCQECPNIGYGFQNYKATCDSEKSEIINTARTQYLTEQQASQTRELVQATANATQSKIDFYAYQGLRDELSKSQLKVAELQNQLFVKEQLSPITAQLSSIQCTMLKRPDVTGVGAVCPNAGIINGLGYNGGCCSGCGSL